MCEVTSYEATTSHRPRLMRHTNLCEAPTLRDKDERLRGLGKMSQNQLVRYSDVHCNFLNLTLLAFYTFSDVTCILYSMGVIHSVPYAIE